MDDLTEKSGELTPDALEAQPEAEAAPDGSARKISESPERFINRELSWLQFNYRVLEEASNPAHPLLERVRFLSISASNLDEFYMVRVAGLRGQMQAGVDVVSQDGLTPAQQVEAIHEVAYRLLGDQQKIWAGLREHLAEVGLEVLSADELDESERAWLEGHFLEQIFPVLTPLAVDPAHPFPFIPNLGIVLAMELRRRSDGQLMNAMMPLPRQVDRFIKLPGSGVRFIPLEEVLASYLEQLFPG
ncbi:MAG: RNA degradosome polyphosphate kinase, partial [Alphaproteobacteria bacterium]|nr:RNA degradosome polyphosphate kinase [Alphaproteobacteria bacterium]